MKNNEVLGGFSALFGEIMPIDSSTREIPGMEVIPSRDGDTNDTVAAEVDTEEPDIDLEPDEVGLEPDAVTESDDSADSSENEESEYDEAEAEQITSFFDALAGNIGWGDIPAEDKPKTAEALVDYIKNSIEASSSPDYANDDVAALDEYVRAGGNMADYINASANTYDLANIDLENVSSQRIVVGDLLKEKGFSDAQIKRKLDNYEDAGILEAEAEDAIESLTEIREAQKKELLDSQLKAYEQKVEDQQNFYRGVVTKIEALTDVRGIKIPKEDKATLIKYMFDVEADGTTRYYKDYASRPENLIESAYFTMKGDALLDKAKRSGETSTVDRFKKSLSSNKVGGSTRKINNGSPTPLWSLASTQLRRPQN